MRPPSHILVALLAIGAVMTPSTSRAAQSYHAEVLSDRPIAYYRLDERAGTIAHDSSGHRRHGAIGRHVKMGAPGLIPDAPTSMEFFGADKSAASEDIRIKGSPVFALANNVSIEAWVVPLDVGVHGKNSGDISIAAYGDDTAPDTYHCRYALELDAHSHVWHFPAVVQGKLLDHRVTGVRSLLKAIVASMQGETRGERDLYAAEHTDGNPPHPSRLYHLVGTYDGETMRMYVNGTLNNVLRVRGRIAGYSSVDGFGIGGEYKDVNPVFLGRISEVAVYDRVLSPDRIAAHYRSGLQRSIAARAVRGQGRLARVPASGGQQRPAVQMVR